jgi:hypothetical protein
MQMHALHPIDLAAIDTVRDAIEEHYGTTKPGAFAKWIMFRLTEWEKQMEEKRERWAKRNACADVVVLADYRAKRARQIECAPST